MTADDSQDLIAGWLNNKAKSKGLKIQRYTYELWLIFKALWRQCVSLRKYFADASFKQPAVGGQVSCYHPNCLSLIESMKHVTYSSMRPRTVFQRPLNICFNTLAPIPDLWSLPKQLLLLQSHPLLLDLLQSHLVVASHELWGLRPSLLHWSALSDPLLVQACKREMKRFRNATTV